MNAHQLKATGRSSSRGSSSTRRRLGGGIGASPPSSSSERRLEPSDGRLRVEPPSGGSDGSESAAPKGVRVGSDSSSRRMLPPSAGRRSECESPPVPPDDADRYDSDDSEDEVEPNVEEAVDPNACGSLRLARRCVVARRSLSSISW